MVKPVTKTHLYPLASWLGLVGLMACLTGCPSHPTAIDPTAQEAKHVSDENDADAWWDEYLQETRAEIEQKRKAHKAYLDQQPHLRDLRPNEYVEVIYTSQGCFHNERFDFLIQPKPGGGLRVTSLEGQESGDLSDAPVLGETLLDDLETQKLDALLDVYRLELETVSTMTDTVRIGWYRDDQPVHRELITDHSAAIMDLEELGDVLSFWGLARRTGSTEDPYAEELVDEQQ